MPTLSYTELAATVGAGLVYIYASWLVVWVLFLRLITRLHGHDGSKYPSADLERLRREGL